MKARLLSWSAALLLLVAASAVVSGYSAGPQSWPSGNVVMHLALGASGSLRDGASSWGQSAEAALSVWNDYLNRSRFTVIRDSTSARSERNLINNVFFAGNAYGDSFGTGTLAVTIIFFTGTRIVETDVIFNSAVNWNSYRGNRIAGLTDFRRVAIHEFGHALGLDHPDEAGQSVSAIMNSTISNLDTVTSDDIAGAQSLYGGGVVSTVAFPPRNEPADFYRQLTDLYANELRASLSPTYVDPEGTVIWLTEYARQRVGQCSQAVATSNTLNQITSGGGTLVCAATPAGTIPFPPRNEGLQFMTDLDNTYRDSLRRSLGSAYVNNEGAVVWVLEYLRYRLNRCNHGDATTKVLQQIRTGFIAPTCA
jgi:hypothetical protein